MAITIPTVAAGRVLTANQADASGTRTFPDLSGLTKNSGDRLIAIVIGYQSAGSSGAVFSSWGGGFTEIADLMTTSGSTMCIGVAEKISTGSETGTFTVTQASPTGHASFILISVPGAHASTAIEVSAIVNGTSSAADPASFDPAGWGAEETLWVSVAASGMTSGTGSWTATGTTAPTNYTDRVDSNTTDNSTVGQTEGAVAFRLLNASSEDVGTAGVDTSNARNSAIVIAVRPAPSVTPISAAITVTLTPAQTKQVSKVVAISATLTAAAVKQVNKALDIGVTLTVDMVKAKFFVRSADIVVTFAVAQTKVLARVVAIAVTLTVAPVRVIQKVAAITVTATVAAVRLVQKGAAVGITFTVGSVRLIQKGVVITVTFVVAVSRNFTRVVAIAVTFSVSTLRQFTKLVGVAISVVADAIATFIGAGAGQTFQIEDGTEVVFDVGVGMEVVFSEASPVDWNKITRELPPAGSVDKIE